MLLMEWIVRNFIEILTHPDVLYSIQSYYILVSKSKVTTWYVRSAKLTTYFFGFLWQLLYQWASCTVIFQFGPEIHLQIPLGWLFVTFCTYLVFQIQYQFLEIVWFYLNSIVFPRINSEYSGWWSKHSFSFWIWYSMIRYVINYLPFGRLFYYSLDPYWLCLWLWNFVNGKNWSKHFRIRRSTMKNFW